MAQDKEEKASAERSEGRKIRFAPEYFVLLFWVVLLLFVAYFYGLLPRLPSIHLPMSPMNQAKHTLKEIGEAQLAYESRNNAKMPGSLKALQEQGLWAQEDSLQTAVPNYWLYWNVPYYTSAQQRQHAEVDFFFPPYTIIAFPNNPQKLHTFAITNDNIVREYNPSHGNQPDSISTWDPVL